MRQEAPNLAAGVSLLVFIAMVALVAGILSGA